MTFASTPVVLLAGAVTSAIVIPVLIAVQHRARLGQHVYEDAPTSHSAKQGTPTAGGIAFLVAALAGFALGSLVCSGGTVRATDTFDASKAFYAGALPLLVLTLACGLIGLADDLLILRARRALGLRARAKFALVALVAGGYVFWVHASGAAALTQTWFGGTLSLPVWAWAMLAVLAIVGAANAVNLTDGLDGLAAGATVPVLIALQLTARYQGIAGVQGIGDAVLGSLLVFLWFNRHPAKIFMGDTGSLALGALLAGLAIQAGALLLLPLFGIVFVVEALSVIVQVISFKATGRRVFRMSPLHHHFELSGWRETVVTATFVMTAVAAAAATWVTWWSTTVRAARLS
jgi:phospho-N-acetylmuramoyl-pentapeptide-transferase